MRYLIFTLLIVYTTTFNARASQFHTIRSKPSDDLILELRLHKEGKNSYRLGPIVYGWLTFTNLQAKVKIPKDEYFCYAQMFNSRGIAIPLRPGFQTLGKSFFDLKYPSNEQAGDAILNTVRVQPPHGTQQTPTVNFVIATQNSAGGGSFNNLDEMFDIKEPGQYRVKLQFQVYVRANKGGNNWVYKLVRFAPVEFNVTKGGK